MRQSCHSCHHLHFFVYLVVTIKSYTGLCMADINELIYPVVPLLNENESPTEQSFGQLVITLLSLKRSYFNYSLRPWLQPLRPLREDKG